MLGNNNALKCLLLDIKNKAILRVRNWYRYYTGVYGGGLWMLHVLIVYRDTYLRGVLSERIDSFGQKSGFSPLLSVSLENIPSAHGALSTVYYTMYSNIYSVSQRAAYLFSQEEGCYLCSQLWCREERKQPKFAGKRESSTRPSGICCSLNHPSKRKGVSSINAAVFTFFQTIPTTFFLKLGSDSWKCFRLSCVHCKLSSISMLSFGKK